MIIEVRRQNTLHLVGMCFVKAGDKPCYHCSLEGTVGYGWVRPLEPSKSSLKPHSPPWTYPIIFILLEPNTHSSSVWTNKPSTVCRNKPRIRDSDKPPEYRGIVGWMYHGHHDDFGRAVRPTLALAIRNCSSPPSTYDAFFLRSHYRIE